MKLMGAAGRWSCSLVGGVGGWRGCGDAKMLISWVGLLLASSHPSIPSFHLNLRLPGGIVGIWANNPKPSTRTNRVFSGVVQFFLSMKPQGVAAGKRAPGCVSVQTSPGLACRSSAASQPMAALPSLAPKPQPSVLWSAPNIWPRSTPASC